MRRNGGSGGQDGGRTGRLAPCLMAIIAAMQFAIGPGIRPAFAQITGGPGGIGGTGGIGGPATGTGGILVDPDGVVRSGFQVQKTARLDRKRRQELSGKSLPGDLNRRSTLRKISLVGLEAACESFARDQRHLPAEMQFLAGLQRIDFVFVYPDEKDIVIAGPAEGFVVEFGRALGVSTGRPALRLDDLIVALRAVERGGEIRCSIDPRPENLAKLTAFIARNREATTLEETRSRFEQLPAILGMQDITVGGVPGESHFAELLVEADIRMKRAAIGIANPPVKAFRSHLALVGSEGNSMQRWWFIPLYDPFVRTANGLAYEFRGQRAQLLSQEELVSEAGRRSNAPFTRVSAQKFAKQFTDRFQEIADATPVFAELQSVFDLAVVAALLKKDRLADRVGWSMELFLDPRRATIGRRHVPRQVESLSNSKVIGGRTFVVQVGGGIQIDAARVLRDNQFRDDSDGSLGAAHDQSLPQERPAEHA